MTRDELKEKVATAIMSRFVKPDMHETVTRADGSKQWRVDHFGEMAEAALSAIEASGMAVVPVEATGCMLDAMCRAYEMNQTVPGEDVFEAAIRAGRVR